MRVFRVRGRQFGATNVFACWRATRRVTRLPFGRFDQPFFGLSGNLPVLIAGSFVGYDINFTPDPDGNYDTLFVVDARTGRTVHHVRPLEVVKNSGLATVSSFVLADDGSLAFIQGEPGAPPNGSERGYGPTGGACAGGQPGVIVVDSQGLRTLDCDTGTEPAGHEIQDLRVRQRTISWTHNADTRSEQLR